MTSVLFGVNNEDINPLTVEKYAIVHKRHYISWTCRVSVNFDGMRLP